MTVDVEAYRRRLELDAAALGMRAELVELERAATLAELDELDLEVQSEAARRSVWWPTPAQLAALEEETAAWLCECNAELADELEELVARAPVVVDARGIIHVRDGDTLRGPAYRQALEDLRERARDAHACCASDEAGWLGPFAEPDDIQRQIDDVDAEVLEVDREVQSRAATATAPAQLDAVAEWNAWVDAWGMWRDSEPSTWWGGTLTELDAWGAQLRDHRERLEAALAGAIVAPVAVRERDPVTRGVERAAEVATSSSGSLALGLGLAAGLGLVIYAAATGRLSTRRA